MRRRVVVLAAVLVVAFGSPAVAARSAKPTKAEQKVCDLLTSSAGADNTVHVDATLAHKLDAAARTTSNKKMIKSARPLASLVKKQQQVGLQVQTLIAECERRGAAPGPLVPAAPAGFSVDQSGSLYSVDLSTGAAVAIGATGISAADVEGLALACDRTLYAIDRTTQSLYTLDISTGVGTKVGSTGLGVEPADAGLTMGTDGRLFMADVNSGNFYEIDLKTGVAAVVGPLGDSVQITGLATRADGTIFGFDRENNELVTIDPDTGLATPVGSAGLTLNLVGVDFDALGMLRGVYSALRDEQGTLPTTFTLDPATGVATDGPDTAPLVFKDLAIGPAGCRAKKSR